MPSFEKIQLRRKKKTPKRKARMKMTTTRTETMATQSDIADLEPNTMRNGSMNVGAAKR